MAGVFQKGRRKNPGFWLAVFGCLLILAALWGEGSVPGLLSHDCGGEHCPVCLRIEEARQLLKALFLPALAACLAVFGREWDIKKVKDRRSVLCSPVALKAKLIS
jgi:hypothetical protein